MCVVLSQTKNGVPAAAWRSMKSSPCSSTSSSIVSIRFFVSGPVSSILCLPTRPKRGSSVSSSSSVAHEWMTPRGPNRSLKCGKSSAGGQFGVLRLLLRVQVVEVAEELVEAVHRRQVLVQVAEVVLAELPRRVAERLQQLGDRHVLGLEADVHAGDADLAQAGAVDALAGDERRPAGRAALLAVRVGEPHPLVGDPVDVRRPVAHQPVAVAAEVRDPDVVAPDHEDVRLVRHQVTSLLRSRGAVVRTTQRKPRCAIDVSIICACRAAGR